MLKNDNVVVDASSTAALNPLVSGSDFIPPPNQNDVVRSNELELGALKLRQSDEEENKEHAVERASHLHRLTDTTPPVANSRWSVIFLMMNSMIGSGIFNEPKVFEESGLVSAMFMLFAASLLTWLGLVALVETGLANKIDDYSQLALYAFGKNGEVAVDASIAFSEFCALLSYASGIEGVLSSLTTSWGCQNEGCGGTFFMILSIAIFSMPFCLFRHLGHFTFISIISMSSVVCVLLLVIIAGPIEGHGTGAQPIVLVDSQGEIKELGSIIFTVSCAYSAFPAFRSLGNKSVAEWRFIASVICMLGFTACAIMGGAGYAAFRQNTTDIILTSFKGSYADFFKLLFVCHLLLYIPMDFVVCRHSLVKLAGTQTGQITSTFWHVFVSFFLIFLVILIVLLLKYKSALSSGKVFSLILNISGGFVGSLVSFVFPAALYVKLTDPKDGVFYYPCVFLVVVGLFLSIVIPIFAIISTAASFS